MKHLFIIIATISLVGCSTINYYEPEQMVGVKQMVKDKRIITDSGLEDRAYVVGINKAEVGGLLKIQAEIWNSTSSFQTVLYKFEWYDRQGMLVTEEPWQTLIMEGKEPRMIQSVAPSPNAKDFRLKLLDNDR